MSTSPPVKTVERLGTILVWSLAELAMHLGLPKSTLHRFLSSLESHSPLRRDPGNKRWYPGYRLLAATGETAILTICHKRESCIARWENHLRFGRGSLLHHGSLLS